jgi:hypothetical protein
MERASVLGTYPTYPEQPCVSSSITQLSLWPLLHQSPRNSLRISCSFLTPSLSPFYAEHQIAEGTTSSPSHTAPQPLDEAPPLSSTILRK